MSHLVRQTTAEPLVRFHRVIAQARLPQRADRAAAGTLPARAARYCDAVTAASAFGYYIFPPMDLSLLWDGADIYWTYGALDRWLLLDAAQFPNFQAAFDAQAPADLIGCAPPFLTALPEPGHVQIWTGLIAQTAPEWSLLVRNVANMPMPGGMVAFEGIVETDRWFGPLFTNIRLTRTHVPINISTRMPLVQVQPLPRRLYTDAVLDNAELSDGLSSFGAAEWEAYRRTVAIPNRDPERPLGAYSIAARRRRREGEAA